MTTRKGTQFVWRKEQPTNFKEIKIDYKNCQQYSWQVVGEDFTCI